MTHLKRILSLFCFIPSLCFGQIVDAAIEMEELNVLYRGYPNKLHVVVSNSEGKKISLTSNELSISPIEDFYYIVKPISSARTAKINVLLIGETDTTLVRSIDYRISNLPKPTLYWGSSKDGEHANIKEKKIFIKYPPEITLNASFKIINWELAIDSSFNIRPVRGKGSLITDAEQVLNKVTKHSSIYMVVTYVGPDDIHRILRAKWEVDSWEQTDEPMDLLPKGE